MSTGRCTRNFLFSIQWWSAKLHNITGSTPNIRKGEFAEKMHGGNRTPRIRKIISSAYDVGNKPSKVFGLKNEQLHFSFILRGYVRCCSIYFKVQQRCNRNAITEVQLSVYFFAVPLNCNLMKSARVTDRTRSRVKISTM